MKLHKAQSSAILSSSLRVEFNPKFHSCLCYHKLVLYLLSLKVKISYFKTSFHSCGFLLLPESRLQWFTSFVCRAESDSLPSLVVTDLLKIRIF